MSKKSTNVQPFVEDTHGKITDAILSFMGRIPHSDQTTHSDPVARAKTIAKECARKAAVASGTLALPPGPFGLLTIIPDLMTIWHIQSQMVADIAALFGKTATLNQQQMLYCLFRHAAALVFRDVVLRVGERFIIRRASLRLLQTMVSKIGVRVTQRLIGKTVSRWVPVVGAVGMAGLAYYDTMQVAKTAIELFQREIDVEPEPSN